MTLAASVVAISDLLCNFPQLLTAYLKQSAVESESVRKLLEEHTLCSKSKFEFEDKGKFFSPLIVTISIWSGNGNKDIH